MPKGEHDDFTSKQSMELSQWALDGVNKAKKNNLDLDELTACVKIAWNVKEICGLMGWAEEQHEKNVDTNWRCNECKYYQGVKFVQGVAPCSFWGIGGVSWKDYCSRWETCNAKE